MIGKKKHTLIKKLLGLIVIVSLLYLSPLLFGNAKTSVRAKEMADQVVMQAGSGYLLSSSKVELKPTIKGLRWEVTYMVTVPEVPENKMLTCPEGIPDCEFVVEKVVIQVNLKDGSTEIVIAFEY